MMSNLYINEVRIDKEIPRDNYLRRLTVVRNLRRMGGLRFHKNVTFPDAEVMEITGDGIRSVDYKDTEHYIVTKRFMDAPEKIVENLLGDN